MKGWVGSRRNYTGGFAIGSFIDNVVLLLLLYLQGRAGIDGLQAKKE